MKSVARIISRVFDPVVIIPLILAGTVSLAYLNGYRWRLFALILVLDAVIPGLYVTWRFWQKRGKDWDIHKREERLPLFGLTVVCHGLGVMTAYWLDRQPLGEILLALWLLAVIYTGITWFWKISVHAGVNATLATMAYLFVDNRLWVLGLPVVVGWARVYGRHHSWAQVLVGMLIPPLMLTSFFWWRGIL